MGEEGELKGRAPDVGWFTYCPDWDGEDACTPREEDDEACGAEEGRFEEELADTGRVWGGRNCEDCLNGECEGECPDRVPFWERPCAFIPRTGGENGAPGDDKAGEPTRWSTEKRSFEGEEPCTLGGDSSPLEFWGMSIKELAAVSGPFKGVGAGGSDNGGGGGKCCVDNCWGGVWLGEFEDESTEIGKIEHTAGRAHFLFQHTEQKNHHSLCRWQSTAVDRVV